MLSKIKLFYYNNRDIIRITRYSLISFILLILTWTLDYKNPGLKRYLPEVLLLSSDVTSSFLSTLSGTFLTVSTFTFTTILTVLNKYSDSFTPRIVQDFIDKPNVLSLFGVFIGGFFYTVLSLFMVQNIDAKVPLISGTIAIFYAVAAMVSFILFVRRVLKDIKVSNVIENVYTKAHGLIEEEAKRRKASERFISTSQSLDEVKIFANETGYFYEVNSKALLAQLKGVKAEVVIEKKIGEYISKGTYIARLHLLEDLEMEGQEKKDFMAKLASGLVINVSKNDVRDYHHEMTNLIEIALMALSPGVNDPNTGIMVIGKISNLLGKLFSTNNFYLVLDENEKTKIIYNGYTVREELYNSFAQIVHYGKEDPMVAEAVLKGLYLIYMLADESVKGQVKEYLDYVYEICLDAMDTKMNRDQLKAIHEDFHQNRDDQSDAEVMKEGS